MVMAWQREQRVRMWLGCPTGAFAREEEKRRTRDDDDNQRQGRSGAYRHTRSRPREPPWLAVQV